MEDHSFQTCRSGATRGCDELLEGLPHHPHIRSSPSPNGPLPQVRRERAVKPRGPKLITRPQPLAKYFGFRDGTSGAASHRLSTRREGSSAKTELSLREIKTSGCGRY